MKNIIKWLFLLPLYVISFFFKRTNKIICFGGFGDKFTDNSRVLFEFQSKNSDVLCVWITGSKKQKEKITQQGFKCELRYSLRGIYYSLRANKYIYACYVSDVNFWTSGNVIGINLWHGSPLKVIENDIKVGPLANIFNPKSYLHLIYSWIFYPSLKRGHDVSFYASIYERDIFKSAFKSKINICALSPRNISLLEVKDNENPCRILFAPSWRSEGVEANNRFNTEIIRVLHQYCKENNFGLDISIHPNSSLKVENNIIYKNVSGVPIEERIREYKLLVTDFSSIAFDFLLLKKEVIFACNDFVDYHESDRGFYPVAFDILRELMCTNINDFESSLRQDLQCEDKFKSLMQLDEACICNMAELSAVIQKI